MRFSSPLANFTELLSEIKSSSKNYLDTLKSNEASTRAVLVDPVIRALGWNINNPAMVEVEKSFFSARVDYALYDSNGEVKVIIEAKKLGENLNNQNILLTLVNYAFTTKVSDIFLTDGILWHHFSGFVPGELEPSKILNIENDELVEIASYLVQRLDAARYWPDEKNVDELSQKINQIQSSLTTLEKLVNREIKRPVSMDKPSTPKEFKNVIEGENNKKDFVKLIEIGNAKSTKPSKLKLPDNTIISVNYWSEVLRECVKYTLDQNPNIQIPLSDKAGKKVKLLDYQPPQKGVSYVELDYKDDNIFLYENYDSNNCIANALYILDKASLEQAKLKVEVIYD